MGVWNSCLAKPRVIHLDNVMDGSAENDMAQSGALIIE